jgi:hypothetical protein
MLCHLYQTSLEILCCTVNDLGLRLMEANATRPFSAVTPLPPEQNFSIKLLAYFRGENGRRQLKERVFIIQLFMFG